MDQVQVVQQLYAEFGKGNVQGVLNLLHDDVTWIDPGAPDIPYAGKRKGKQEVQQFFMGMGGALEFTRFEPQQFFTDGNFVLVKGYFAGKSRSTGKSAESDWMMMWEVVNGKVKSYQAFLDTHNLVSAFK